MTTRRAFIGTLAGGLVVAPRAADAEPAAKVPRIGYLVPNLAASPHLHEAFRRGLRDLGYVERRNVVIDYRDAHPALSLEGRGIRIPSPPSRGRGQGEGDRL